MSIHHEVVCRGVFNPERFVGPDILCQQAGAKTETHNEQANGRTGSSSFPVARLSLFAVDSDFFRVRDNREP